MKQRQGQHVGVRIYLQLGKARKTHAQKLHSELKRKQKWSFLVAVSHMFAAAFSVWSF
jgi:hypothetical protein